jgi:hypothetical protein
MGSVGSGTSRVERYLAHLDALSGGVEPQFWPIESTKPGLKGLTAIGYRELPEAGMFLGLTYGLSLADHPLWRHGKPELCICVASDDPLWVLAVATLAEHLRGDCPFQYGDTLDFGEPVAPGTDMDGFVAFAPSVLDRDDARVEVGDGHPINLVGLYPTFLSERQFIRQRGLEAFWKLDWDPYDVGRGPAV